MMYVVSLSTSTAATRDSQRHGKRNSGAHLGPEGTGEQHRMLSGRERPQYTASLQRDDADILSMDRLAAVSSFQPGADPGHGPGAGETTLLPHGLYVGLRVYS